MFKVVVYWRWSLTRRGRYERVNCKHVKGVLFVNRKYTKGVPFLSEKKGYKRFRGWTSGRSLTE